MIAEDVEGELLGLPRSVEQAEAELPRSSGLYAWWASPSVLPDLPGLLNPLNHEVRLLYVGIATRLRTRVVSNHLRRSGSSTLRRTFAGLLLDDLGLQTRWTDRVVLTDKSEGVLTTWMRERLSLSWAEASDPAAVEPGVIDRLKPPLNVDHAPNSSVREAVTAARRRYCASAGPRPEMR